ncbi:hypothetical protein HK102_011099 [Quaeritorhiza haematococci]|nr:hypothetical protein HK102_011099 [Quaeritorhiza haematococci]
MVDGGMDPHWILAIAIVVVVGLLLAVILPHNLRVRRVRQVSRTLPTDEKDRILGLIVEMASQGPSLTLLLVDRNRRSDEEAMRLQSHVGGSPYAEAGDDRPLGASARFLLQVRLDEPTLGQQWEGRLLTVYLVHDVELVVRSYAAPSPERRVALLFSDAQAPAIALRAMRFPMEVESREPMSPARICETSPAVRERLDQFTDDRVGLLSQILRPDLYGYDLEAPDIAYFGGEPMLIQCGHDPVCDECGSPMRFLFQFGEIIPGLQLGDGGVGYVYGCDDHPRCCKGFLDSH